MQTARKIRYSFKSRCAGLMHEHISESVVTDAGVEVFRVKATPGSRSFLNVSPHPAYALVMTTIQHSGWHFESGARSTGGSRSTISNFAHGCTLETDLNQELILAYLPESAFDNVSGRWQLVAAPVKCGLQEVKDDPAARYLCLALLSRPATERPLEAVFANNLSLALLTHFLRLYCPVSRNRDDEPGIRLEPWQLRIAEESMLARLDQRLPVAVVAERCGVSAVHFSRAFRRTTSDTPHRWLMRRRLEKACSLLVNTDETIADIALACGFSDQSHLTRTFSLLIGTTPASWRASQHMQAQKQLP